MSIDAVWSALRYRPSEQAGKLAANQLYASAGFTDFVRDFHWQKEF